MVGLGLSFVTDGMRLASNGKLPKMSKRWFFKHIEIYNAMNDFTEEELDKVKADCEAGKWSKKLPGKPLLWAFMSKKTRKRKYLQMFAVSVDVIKYQRKICYEAFESFSNPLLGNMARRILSEERGAEDGK